MEMIPTTKKSRRRKLLPANKNHQITLCDTKNSEQFENV